MVPNQPPFRNDATGTISCDTIAMKRRNNFSRDFRMAVRLKAGNFSAILILAQCLASVAVLSRPAVADDSEKRQVQIDPISRNFMAPSLEDFVRPNDLGLTFDELTFRNQSGSDLRGWFIPANGGRQTILFCMGNTGNISGMLLYAKLLVEGGFNVFLFDYQGYGGSGGIATAMSLHGDAISAFDYLTTQRNVKASEIGVFGVSLGSPLAIAVATQRGAGAVAAEDVLLPLSHLERMKKSLPDDLATRLAVGAIQNVVIPTIDPLQNVPRLKCPMFLMHGENDRLLSPSGTVQIAEIAEVPTRTWIMSGAGHAPETLEVNELEYATQITEFFRSAFAGTLTIPKPSLKVHSHGDKWIAEVSLECRVPGAWQIAIGSQVGRFVFVRRMVVDEIQVTAECDFVPTHVSAVRFHHVEPQPDGTWQPQLTALSQSLAAFRRFERQVDENCKWISRDNSIRNRQFTIRRRDPLGMEWLLSNLPNPLDIHSSVRPRYGRKLSAFYCSLDPDGQLKCRDLLPAIWSFLPDNPERYYQLDNAAYQVRLEDRCLSLCLIHLAKKQFDKNQLASARSSLRMAQRISPQDHAIRSLNVEELGEESDFDRFVGGGQ
jgi:pimeloyl-ACP methyl ester carboxylesterase